MVVYDRARVEPTLDSFQEAADFARDAEVDGFVSVGGGSSIDTAKVADLITTHPAPVMDYVNPPVGEGRKPPSPLRPHLAIPTTSGTGAEATTVAVLDIPDMKVKTGISHRYLRPAQGIVDPELVRTLPARGHLLHRPRRDLPRGRVVPRRAPTTSASGPRRPTSARPTRAPIPWPTCGRPRRSSTAGATCAAPSPTPRTSRRAAP